DEVAQRTRVWHVRAGEPLPASVPPFRLTGERCRTMFEQVTGWIERTRTWFVGHRVLELEYAQDLEGGFGATLERIFELLAVPSVHVEKRLETLARIPPREQLANFDELAAMFAGTRFAPLFK